MVTGSDIVAAAYEVLGAPYRTWYLGMSLPTWLDDGRGDPPPVEHLMYTGLECADLIAYALARNGLPYPYQAGTQTFEDFLVNTSPFDPSAPGEPGAIALCPYRGPAWADQGHIACFVDEHRLIQALGSGVTDAWTDSETYSWGGSTEFTIYGYLPGVSYEGSVEVAPGTKVPEGGYVAIGADGNLVIDGEDCSRGWYTLPSWDYKGWRWTKEGGYL